MTTAPKFYRYDNDGYFHSVITASRDPLESKIAGHDVYITPNSSTAVEPAKKEGYWAHWNGEAWDYVALPKNADELIAFGKIKHDQTVPFWKKMNDLRNEFLTDGSKYTQELKEGYWVSQLLHSSRSPQALPLLRIHGAPCREFRTELPMCSRY